ncbi:MAG TPA: hypothetical protein VEJ63_05875 [Planctomycetota bacterium]|nr:hypothetical protein [Planctomycetota bacterium]
MLKPAVNLKTAGCGVEEPQVGQSLYERTGFTDPPCRDLDIFVGETEQLAIRSVLADPTPQSNESEDPRGAKAALKLLSFRMRPE